MGEVRIGSGTFRTREIVLGAVATLAVVLCIVFLGLYANKGGDGKSGATNSGAARQQATTGKSPGKQTTTGKTTTIATAATTTPASTQPTCKDGICLETTAYVWSLVNTSVDPCEDFYSYACGRWDDRNPLEPDQYSTSVMSKLYYKNKELIRRLIESAKARNVPWSAERKVKDLYKSCMDDYGRTVAGANPFLEKVINKVGGWFVLGNFDASSWDILDHLEKIHVDFWTDVLFKVTVITDWSSDRRRRYIALLPGGTGMYSYHYTSPYSYSNKTRQDYMKFIRTMGSYLVDDSGISITADERKSRLDTFVSDVMEVETRIANLTISSPYNFGNTFDYSERVRIRDLAALTGPPFQWVSFFRYMFDNMGTYTSIAVPSKTYVRNLAADIDQLGSDKKRKLNNYMTWRLLSRYRLEMSSKYLHAGREYYNDRYGIREYPQTWETCFNYVRYAMPDAISHIFVKNHFLDKNKDKVTEIAGYVKQALVDGMSSNNSFLDPDTKKIALDKVQAVIEKLGYPDFLLDKDKVDVLYKDFTVSASDFFSNALSANKLLKQELKYEYIGQWLRYWDKTQWDADPYSTSYRYIRNWNEIEIPAGLLQHPIYDYNLAHYLNFGSMGNIIADTFINAVDYYGSRYDRQGRRVTTTVQGYTGWYKPATVTNFNSRKSCLTDQFVNKTSGSYVDPNTGRTIEVQTSRRTAEMYARNLLDDIWGVKTGIQAYQAWVKKNGQEPLPPVIGLTPTQMYFVSYMQTRCYVTNSRSDYYRVRYGGVTQQNQYNAVVAQLKEFSQAFKCSAKATLNPMEKCIMS